MPTSKMQIDCPCNGEVHLEAEHLKVEKVDTETCAGSSVMLGMHTCECLKLHAAESPPGANAAIKELIMGGGVPCVYLREALVELSALLG